MRHSVLDVVPTRERESLLAAARPREFPPGEVVQHQGDLGNSLSIIESGHALIRMTTPRGDTVTLGLLGPCDEFGELSLLRGDHCHTATIVALDRLRTIRLSRADFTRVCAADPAVAFGLAHLFAVRVEALGEQLAEAYYLPASRRVARRLSEAVEVYGCAQIPLTQDDLAGLAGTSRPTTNRVLRALEGQGVVELDRHAIVVMDERALQAAGRW